MQTLADVLNMPIRVLRSEQACALGAAMFAAVAAGVYSDINEAVKCMGSDMRHFTENILNLQDLLNRTR